MPGKAAVVSTGDEEMTDPVKMEIELHLTTQDLAEGFARLDASEQARFFVLVGNDAATWKSVNYSILWGTQFISAGRALRDLDDEETERARDVILYLLMGLYPHAESFRGDVAFRELTRKS